jgi:autotransporter-associated beta strand protein
MANRRGFTRSSGSRGTTSGTTRIEGNIDLGSTARTIEVAAAGTLVLDGVLTNNSGTASGTITKQGPGTLVLTQNNAATLTTFRIGVSSGTTGGTVKSPGPAAAR